MTLPEAAAILGDALETEDLTGEFTAYWLHGMWATKEQVIAEAEMVERRAKEDAEWTSA